jgi:arginase family enzyme
MTFAAFGCALDVLDAPEKLALKLAYMNAVREGLVDESTARDPYDLVVRELSGVEGLVTVGRLELESWMTPRPRPDALDRVDVLLYREFLDTGGCVVVSARVREFVRQMVLPLSPFLIGVDHSLTGGVLDAICGPDPGEMALIVLDSHFDAIPASVRKAAAAVETPGEAALDKPETDDAAEREPPASYNCGTWLAGVIERGLIAPADIVVIGPSDHPGTEEASDETAGMKEFRRSYLELEKRGVKVIPKRRVCDIGVEKAAREALEGLTAPSVYISLDADLGAGEEVKAVRFLDTIGLEPGEVVGLCGSLAGEVSDRGMALAGFDAMEIDVHLADIPASEDRTVEMCAAAARRLLGAPGD